MSQTSTCEASIQPECCGPDTAKMIEGCPCASAMKGHWKKAVLVMSLVFLAFLISQIGGILGMIAFFRTF